MTRVLLAAACAMLLVACSSTGTSAPARSGSRMASGSALLQQVRSAGQVGNELDVQPLRDPQVEDLRARATAAEARADWASAQRALASALEITPQDPELLQWQAEMALVGHDFARAQQLATQSWDRGPKLGGLCRRNWTTIRFAAESRGDAAAAAQAQQRAGACAVAPPNRF
jgi:Flp pilus assembly protein TadD